MVDFVGPILSGFFSVLFGRIAERENLLLRSLTFDSELIRLMRKLRMLFLSLKVVVDDAEEKGLSDVFVSAWLESLKNIMYDTDEILDQMQFESQSNNWLQNVFSSLNPNGLGSRIFKIVDQLEELVQQKDLFSLVNIIDELPSLSVPTTSLTDESEVFGREVDKENILKEFLLQEHLNKEKGRLAIAVIVGVPGIGKSTLAQILFNDKRVKDCFDVTSWVYISHGQDALEITKKIYECVTLSHCDITDLNILQMKLKDILHEKRFLIVLDDIWKIEFLVWDILQIPFRAGDGRSRLIMTSRYSSVASVVRASLTYQISYLSFKDSCLLFDRYASTSKICLDLKLRDRIVKNCFNHPLVIKIVAEYLSSIDDVEIWDKVSTANVWDIPSGSMRSLVICYARLSSYIKSCLTYCCIFPTEAKIQRPKLIRLWRAEGLLPGSNAEKIEELGNECIKELVSISFMKEEDEGSTILIPSIVHEFARKMAGKFSYTQMEFHPLNVSEENIKYLSFDMADYKDLLNYKWLEQLRTIMDFHKDRGWSARTEADGTIDLLSKLKCVRTVALKRLKLFTLSNSLMNLKHVRYLDLSYTPIVEISESIDSLINLETLMLCSCENLQRLPNDMGNLSNLDYLDLRGTTLSEMPPSFSELHNLTVLTNFFVKRDSDCDIGAMENFLKLSGSLSIMNLEEVVEANDASRANLKTKKHLKKLEFIWTATLNPDIQKDTNVLDNLQPHKYLERLTIKNFSGILFPSWLQNDSLCHLVVLKIIGCRNCTTLPSLGQLPSLSRLSLTSFTSLESIGPEFYGSRFTRPFRSLTFLEFKDMHEWKEWLHIGDFLSCVHIHLEKCPLITPEELPSYSKLTTEECPLLNH